MATQYTDILRLALPITGELDGSWGDVVNDSITSMVEQAVAGMATINTWSANSHTLTVVDGAASESRCAILLLDDDGLGNPSAAATVVCPTETKLYIVDNRCGQVATIKTAAGTGVDVLNGSVVAVFCDGTNVKISSEFSAGLKSSSTNGIFQITGPSAGSTRVATVPDDNFTVARTDAGQIFTGTQVMTSPRIVIGINDTNGNEVISLTATPSAVNDIAIANAATGNSPSLSAVGSDSNINVVLTPKGSGTVNDNRGKMRAIPQSGSEKTTGYTLQSSDVGQVVILGNGGSVTAPGSTFISGDAVSVYNNTGSTKTINFSVTAYLAGVDTTRSSVTLAPRGVATILYTGTSSCVVTGNIL